MLHGLLLAVQINAEARAPQICLSHFLCPHVASCISSCHLSPSCSSQRCRPRHLPVLFCLPPNLFISRGPECWFLLWVAGEILTRLWCLLIVPLSNWGARRSPSPWWRQQSVPLVTVSHPQTHQRERMGRRKVVGDGGQTTKRRSRTGSFVSEIWII